MIALHHRVLHEADGQGRRRRRRRGHTLLNGCRIALLAGGLAAIGSVALCRTGVAQSFDEWRAGLQSEASASGLTSPQVAAAIQRARYLPKVAQLDRAQPEFATSFWQYIDARVTPARIETGRSLYWANEAILRRIDEVYGVPPRILLAFWGLETDYGRFTGDFEIVSALASLAYDSRRAAFFRQQLIAFLQLVDASDVTAWTQGSWAGAFGQMQFMPTTFRDYAVDFDGDNRRNLQDDRADILASAANYLASSGWNRWQTWGLEVVLPPGFDYFNSGMDVQKDNTEWAALGVVRADGTALPDAGKGSIILPAGASGPAFLVFDNFRVILRWNKSVNYALAVGYLSDRIGGGGPLVTPSPAYPPMMLSRGDITYLQTLLISLGFQPGEPDGLLGENTRRAIQGYQRSVGLPADGFADQGLLQQIQATLAAN